MDVHSEASAKPYCYQYPHPAVTTDVVLFTLREDCLQLLLIERGNEPFKGHWALPGGFVDIDEDIDACAARELAEETGVDNIYLEQLGTFGKPGRDPRERVISVAYLALAPQALLAVQAGDDAAAAAWFPVADLPALAFDHAEIIAVARTTPPLPFNSCRKPSPSASCSASTKPWLMPRSTSATSENGRKHWSRSKKPANCADAAGIARRGSIGSSTASASLS